MKNLTIANIQIHHQPTVHIPPVELIKLQMANYNRLSIRNIKDEEAIRYYLRSYLCVYCAFSYKAYESEHTPLEKMDDTLWDTKCANLPTVGGQKVTFSISHPQNVTWKVSNNKISPKLVEVLGGDPTSIAFELLAWHLPIDIELISY